MSPAYDLHGCLQEAQKISQSPAIDAARCHRVMNSYPERFAQEALGHNSKAVHRAYARKAKVELPPLSEYEQQRTNFALLPK